MRSAFVTLDGARWVPGCLTAIDSSACTGRGRYFKVCSREVMHLHGVGDPGELLGACGGEDDDFDGELNRMIMVVDHAGRCIGCGACGHLCPKDCQTHVAADKVAASSDETNPGERDHVRP
ncbi:ferredoxin III, nif-specific [Mesorhizobium shangrilense]|uniref:Ferredoxin III n=1 Tax=Mesorhizobium shangrilense TaxID=460060 RepID=A0ABV2DTL9_9HYPH